MSEAIRTKKYTPDDIWAMFAESRANMDRMSKEADERAKKFAEEAAQRDREADKRAKEAAERAKKFAEEAAQRDREAAQRDREAAQRAKEADERLKKLEELVGGVGNNAGFHAEQFFQDILLKTLTFGGEKYDSMHANLPYARGEEKGEFDIVLANCKSVAIIEVKNRIHPNDVAKMTDKKLPSFRKFFPKYNDCKVYLGLAGFSFCNEVAEEAKKLGIGIIRQVGESVEIDAEHLTAY